MVQLGWDHKGLQFGPSKQPKSCLRLNRPGDLSNHSGTSTFPTGGDLLEGPGTVFVG